MNDATRGTLNEAAFAAMKDGVRIVNLARGELVDTPALKAALDSGKCAAYVTDFPNSETAAIEGVVAIPHLGASTPRERGQLRHDGRPGSQGVPGQRQHHQLREPAQPHHGLGRQDPGVRHLKGADAAAIAGAVPAVASASNTRGSMPTPFWTPTLPWTKPPSQPSPACSGCGY